MARTREEESARRRQAERRGHRGETLAAIALRLRGYRILARRFRTRAGEIDLIARKGDVIAFVEVKARAGTLLAIDAVPAATQRRIRAAGDIWLAQQYDRGRDYSGYTWRYDIVVIRPRRWPTHFTDAF
ncbi:YraN family protein [Pararhizobium haloflavum]|uniref:YraN family protein n=1 Tax=Pararhizobium haloflavum TaxID=2037914 RepID=UPI000C1827A9|nr:YraN family protein [Pararhizobium haloflavum]